MHFLKEHPVRVVIAVFAGLALLYMASGYLGFYLAYSTSKFASWLGYNWLLTFLSLFMVSAFWHNVVYRVTFLGTLGLELISLSYILSYIFFGTPAVGIFGGGIASRLLLWIDYSGQGFLLIPGALYELDLYYRRNRSTARGVPMLSRGGGADALKSAVRAFLPRIFIVLILLTAFQTAWIGAGSFIWSGVGSNSNEAFWVQLAGIAAVLWSLSAIYSAIQIARLKPLSAAPVLTLLLVIASPVFYIVAFYAGSGSYNLGLGQILEFVLPYAMIPFLLSLLLVVKFSAWSR